MEHLAEPVDRDVGDHAERAGDHDGRDLVVGRDDGGRDEQQGGGDDDFELLELAGLRERTFEPFEPLDLAVFEDEVQEEHQQEHAAECRDLRMRVGDQGLVAGIPVREVCGSVRRRVQREVECRDGAEPGRDPHDREREHQTHTEDGDEDADGEEDPLPELAHPAQHGRVDDRIVERQRNLEDAEDHAEEQSLRAAVEERHHERYDGDGHRRTEYSQNHEAWPF